MTKVYYHSVDCDGVASAAIINHFIKGAEFIGINYGQPFPWDSIQKDETVFMVDFSLQPFEDMVRLNDLADLIWIDHHKSAIESYEAAKKENSSLNIKGIQRIGLGACAFVWEWFDRRDLPETIRYLAEYDVWKHDDPDTVPFQYGIQTYDLASDPLNPGWCWMLNPGYDNIERVLEKGRVILSYIKKDNARKIKTLAFEHEVDGLKVIAANFGPSSSKIFDSVWDPEKYDAMMLFSWHKIHWTVSLYSDKKYIDVSVIAKNRGGGGHKGAAGFQIQSLEEIGLGELNGK